MFNQAPSAFNLDDLKQCAEKLPPSETLEQKSYHINQQIIKQKRQLNLPTLPI